MKTVLAGPLVPGGFPNPVKVSDSYLVFCMGIAPGLIILEESDEEDVLVKRTVDSEGREHDEITPDGWKWIIIMILLSLPIIYFVIVLILQADMRSILRNRYLIICSAAICILLLGITVLVEEQYITSELLTSNKDLIELVFKFLETLTVVIIGIFTFIRFFKGHVFINKIEVELEIKTFELVDKVIHVLNILIKNYGPFTEYDPRVQVRSYFYKETKADTDVLWPGEPKNGINKVILPNDNTFFTINKEYEKIPTVVFFEVEVGIRNGARKIRKTLAVHNKERGKD